MQYFACDTAVQNFASSAFCKPCKISQVPQNFTHNSIKFRTLPHEFRKPWHRIFSYFWLRFCFYYKSVFISKVSILGKRTSQSRIHLRKVAMQFRTCDTCETEKFSPVSHMQKMRKFRKYACFAHFKKILRNFAHAC